MQTSAPLPHSLHMSLIASPGYHRCALASGWRMRSRRSICMARSPLARLARSSSERAAPSLQTRRGRQRRRGEHPSARTAGFGCSRSGGKTSGRDRLRMIRREQLACGYLGGPPCTLRSRRRAPQLLGGRANWWEGALLKQLV